MPDSHRDAAAVPPVLSSPSALRPTLLADYRPPAFLIDTVELAFRLDPAVTTLRTRMTVRRNPASGEAAAPLRLDGVDIVLVGLFIDGVAVDQEAWRQDETGLTLHDVPDAFVLETQVTLAPALNTQLSGLYTSGGAFFTQCEAEGFRRITFFPDRPDVMARYSVTLDASRALCPVLLSNGNQVAAGESPGGRHWARWEDPHPKPSYLFALVAGDLVAVRDGFRTASGRDVALAIWVRAGDERSCDHAMASLKRAMLWDEQRFGLQYDLDVFNIAAVSDFNMGAMENKGLNVFNTSFILARPETATDDDYASIERVIAHEYFHNWTGNRITCRDWFQLSLKEGLTVLRDQLYCEDLGSAPLQRVREVGVLRAAQFREDAGPFAHPVRPDSYIAIDNFYTATIYRKGAELVRMIRLLIGPEGFRRGMDLYVARHDNQAVTIDDFRNAMQDASGVDLTEFRLWYEQAGTPVVTVDEAYEASARRYTLTLTQRTAPTPGEPEKRALPIPIAMGLLDAAGRALPVGGAGEGDPAATRVLMLTDETQSFVFEEMAERPVPSLLRNFSAPVRLAGLSRAQLRFLAEHDSDPFVRWDSGQQHAMAVLLESIMTGAAPYAALVDIAGALLAGAAADPAFAAEALRLPGHGLLAEAMAVADHPAIDAARKAAASAIARALAPRLRETYDRLADTDPQRIDGVAAGRRALRNVCLELLAKADAVDGARLAAAQAEAGRCMTEVLAALGVLAGLDCPQRAGALTAFAQRWQGDALVMDKWFAVQAAAPLPGAIERVRALTALPAYDRRTPNRVRAVFSSFAIGNLVQFHDASGEGYRLLADELLAIDRLNGQNAARLSGAFDSWRRQEPVRQALMQAELVRIRDTVGLSRWTMEKVARSLG